MAMNPVLKKALVQIGVEIGCVIAGIVGKLVVEKAEKQLIKVREEKSKEFDESKNKELEGVKTEGPELV